MRAAEAPGAMNALPCLSRLTTSAPESRARVTIAATEASPSTSASGRPAALACDSGITISSPWLPSATARTCPGRSPAAWATRARNRAVSSTPAMPITRAAGKPDARHACCVISSSGLVTTTSTAAGATAATRAAMSPTMAALTVTRSPRLIPG